MKTTLAWILVSIALVHASWASEMEWPDDMARVRTMVQKAVGDIPYNRVKVRQTADETYVSIKLENLPRRLRTPANEAATEEDVYLAIAVVELFEPDFSDEDIMSFDLTPSADILSHFYGYAVYNFGKKIKLRSVIKVRNVADAEPEIEKIKKRLKLKPKTLNLVFVERKVKGKGLYELCTSIGKWQILSYFCVGC